MQRVIHRILCCGMISVGLAMLSFADADDVIYTDGSSQDVQSIPSNPATTIQFALTRCIPVSKSIATLTIDVREKLIDKVTKVFENVAEASSPAYSDAVKDYIDLEASLQMARSLQDIRLFVTEKYYQLLAEKQTRGGNERIIVESFKLWRPDPLNTQVVDKVVDDLSARLAVSSTSGYGPIYGVVDMIREGIEWKLNNEVWYLDHQHILQKYDLRAHDPFQQHRVTSHASKLKKRNEFKKYIAKADFHLNSNIWGLKPMPGGYTKDEALMLIFVLDREKLSPSAKRLKEMRSKVTDKQMHMIWTGSKRLLPKQRFWKPNQMMDVSLADESDGYLPNRWNLRLPDEAPEEVYASFLLNF